MDPKKRPCICGVEHLFSACPYIIESTRPTGWVADPETQRKVDEKLQLAGVKAAVERARQRVAKNLSQGKKTQGGTLGSSTPNELEKAAAFTVSCYTSSNSSDYDLRNSFILDSGASVHVCNAATGFITLSPPLKMTSCTLEIQLSLSRGLVL